MKISTSHAGQRRQDTLIALLPVTTLIVVLAGCGGRSATPLTSGETDYSAITRSASPSPSPTPKPDPDRFPGSVTKLVTGKSFTLTPPPAPPGAPPDNKPALTVTFDSTTKIVNPKGETVTLKEGAPVDVNGKLDKSKATVAAKAITVLPPPPVNGAITSIDSTKKTFVIQPPAPPQGATPPALTVITNTKTVVVKVKPGANPGAPPTFDAATFADLKAQAPVSAFGPVDKTARTVQADRVEILPPPKKP